MIDLDMGSLSDTHEVTAGHRSLGLKQVLFTVYTDNPALRLQVSSVVKLFPTECRATDRKSCFRSMA